MAKQQFFIEKTGIRKSSDFFRTNIFRSIAYETGNFHTFACLMEGVHILYMEYGIFSYDDLIPALSLPLCCFECNVLK